jgi:hypothetical protein
VARVCWIVLEACVVRLTTTNQLQALEPVPTEILGPLINTGAVRPNGIQLVPAWRLDLWVRELACVDTPRMRAAPGAALATPRASRASVAHKEVAHSDRRSRRPRVQNSESRRHMSSG